MSEPAKDEAELLERIADTLRACDTEDKCGYLVQATESLAAIRAAGWAVVPVKPTDKMIWEARAADWDASPERLTWADGYRLMLAAAPGVKP